jgi:hypothetical protein
MIVTMPFLLRFDFEPLTAPHDRRPRPCTLLAEIYFPVEQFFYDSKSLSSNLSPNAKQEDTEQASR